MLLLSDMPHVGGQQIIHFVTLRCAAQQLRGANHVAKAYVEVTLA